MSTPGLPPGVQVQPVIVVWKVGAVPGTVSTSKPALVTAIGLACKHRLAHTAMHIVNNTVLFIFPPVAPLRLQHPTPSRALTQPLVMLVTHLVQIDKYLPTPLPAWALTEKFDP